MGNTVPTVKKYPNEEFEYGKSSLVGSYLQTHYDTKRILANQIEKHGQQIRGIEFASIILKFSGCIYELPFDKIKLSEKIANIYSVNLVNLVHLENNKHFICYSLEYIPLKSSPLIEIDIFLDNNKSIKLLMNNFITIIHNKKQIEQLVTNFTTTEKCLLEILIWNKLIQKMTIITLNCNGRYNCAILSNGITKNVKTTMKYQNNQAQLIQNPNKNKNSFGPNKNCIKGCIFGYSIGNLFGLNNNRLVKGQITEISELCVSIMYGLLKLVKNKNKVTNKKIFDISFIANEFKLWKESNPPFELGITVASCLNLSPNVKNMKLKSKNLNDNSQYGGSKSNGSLMRVIIYALYCINLQNKVFEMLDKYLKEELNRLTLTNPSDKIENITEVIEWLKISKTSNINSLHTINHGAFIPVCFQRAFYHLYNETSFYDAINTTRNEGGDYLGNCSIVGGLLGAYYGYNSLNTENKKIKSLLDDILKCNPEKNRLKYQPRQYSNYSYNLVDYMVEHAPKDDEIEIISHSIEN